MDSFARLGLWCGLASSLLGLHKVILKNITAGRCGITYGMCLQMQLFALKSQGLTALMFWRFSAPVHRENSGCFWQTVAILFSNLGRLTISVVSCLTALPLSLSVGFSFVTAWLSWKPATCPLVLLVLHSVTYLGRAGCFCHYVVH